MVDEYDQSGEFQEPEFYEEDLHVAPKPQRFSSKMPGTNAEHQKAWRLRNPEKHRENMRRYMADRRKKL